ncbi:hypothetical protein EON66_12300, partial [archaeon]
SEHYSAVRYLGSRVIAALQQDMGAGLYYNTLVRASPSRRTAQASVHARLHPACWRTRAAQAVRHASVPRRTSRCAGAHAGCAGRHDEIRRHFYARACG